MLHRLHEKKLGSILVGIQVGLLVLSLLYMTPVGAQQGDFLGRYDVTQQIVGIELTAQVDMYRSMSNTTLSTYYGDYNPHYVTSRPDYRLQSESQGYIDISDQYSYSNANGDLVKSTTTYTIRLSGYQQVTFISTFEFGNYVTLTDNDTLYEEAYTERYYEDGVYQTTTEYHEYTFLMLDGSSLRTETITVPAGEFECFLLDNYVFEGFATDITNPDSWDYYQGGYLVWLDLDDGAMIRQWQYDEYDDVVAEMELVTLALPGQNLLGGNTTLLLVAGGGAAAVVVVAALIMRSRRSEPSYPSYPQPAVGFN